MSHESYTKWWITSKKQLEDLQVRDKITQATSKMTKDRAVANHLIGGLYVRYSMIVQDLAACLDQYCLIQKRFTMRKLVDAAVIRLNEFKDELTKINMSEYHYVDGNLIELKLIPHQIQILDPALVFDRNIDIEDLWTRIKNGETIYEPPPPPEPEPQRVSVETQAPEQVGASTQTKVEETPHAEGTPAVDGHAEGEAPPEGAADEKAAKHKDKKQRRPTVQKYVPPVKTLTEEEIAAMKRQKLIDAAAFLIQKHERGRQCRILYCDLDTRRKLRVKATGGKLKKHEPPELQDKAAIDIQRIWKGHAVRQHQKRREISRRYLIGMIEPSWKSTIEQNKYQKTIEYRRTIREQHLRDYIKANLAEKERVLRVIGPGLMEDIGDEIREWFHRWYSEIKNFDKYPPEELGGSILIVRGETMTPKQWLDEVERLRREKEKAKGKGAKDDKAKKAEMKKKEAEKKKKEKERLKKEAEALKKKEAKGEFDYIMRESIAYDKFKAGFKEYREVWDERPDSENPEQKLYMDMINDKKCYEMQLEIRPQVDELMRLELEMLTEALENDKWKAKGKKGKRKDKKKKKGKGKKGKKGKKNKDPTANRSTEDLFQELVDNGIIHAYPKVNLSEYKGDFSYGNWERRNLEFDPPATLGDVRTAVMLNCILPLGVESMVKPKSVLIAGHRKSGKHLLANAVFYETRCVLFDLSPPILAGKYPGKKGMKMLVHLINKMSRILQPSVIYIDGGEKPFYKKVPKQEKNLEPKKMGKQLFKGIVKIITPDDKVLVLGISGQPFAAKAAGLKKAFDRVILIPRTDYGSVYLYWRELLMPFHGLDRNFSVSELAKLTVTYPLPTLKEAVQKVLVPSRLVQLKFKPLDAHELIEALLDLPEPVIDKEWKKFEGWFKKTPLSKKRAVFMLIAAEKREAEAKAAEKANKSKKK